MARPSPEPVSDPVRSASIRRKGVASSATCSGSRIAPLFSTVITARPPSTAKSVQPSGAVAAAPGPG